MDSQRFHRTIGARLRELREAAHLTQESLAERADLHSTFVSKLERGAAGVSVDTIAALCWALGEPLSEFFRTLNRRIEVKAPRRPGPAK